MVGWAKESNADFVILGGDFNTSPTDKVRILQLLFFLVTRRHPTAL